MRIETFVTKALTFGNVLFLSISFSNSPTLFSEPSLEIPKSLLICLYASSFKQKDAFPAAFSSSSVRRCYDKRSFSSVFMKFNHQFESLTKSLELNCCKPVLRSSMLGHLVYSGRRIMGHPLVQHQACELRRSRLVAIPSCWISTNFGSSFRFALYFCLFLFGA